MCTVREEKSHAKTVHKFTAEQKWKENINIFAYHLYKDVMESVLKVICSIENDNIYARNNAGKDLK